MLNAYGAHVVLKPTPPKEVTEGGLHIPTQAQRKPREATVVSVQERIRMKNEALVDPGFVVGDRVLIGALAADHKFYESEGEKFIICHFEDVLGVLEGDAAIEGRGPGTVDSRGKHHPGHY